MKEKAKRTATSDKLRALPGGGGPPELRYRRGPKLSHLLTLEETTHLVNYMFRNYKNFFLNIYLTLAKFYTHLEHE